MKQTIRDWARTPLEGDHYPCVVIDCWVEALAPRRALCAVHELAYIARHGRPSAEVTPEKWGQMLHEPEFKNARKD